jgi:TIR domain
MSNEPDQNFDVFLSHNTQEKPLIIAIGNQLRDRGLRVWLDAWELRPGLSWQEGILQGLSCSTSCAVMIGRAGYSGWHKREMEAALLRQGPGYPVIPVLLPGAPDRTDVNAFLSLLTWVDFRTGTDDEEALGRLIWGITGLRPERATEPRVILPPASATNSQFKILNPKNGDLLNGPSIVAGIGPPDEDVFLRYKSPDWENFHIGAIAKTDETGRWVMLGPQNHFDLSAGPYELYASGAQDRARSHLVTIFYRDSSNGVRVAQRIRRHLTHVEISYELYDAFIETTKLKKGRLISSGRLAGPVENIESIASSVGDTVATKLRGLVAKDELEVKIEIDSSGKIDIKPETAWASYYAFPVKRGQQTYGFPPGTDLPSLKGMRETQMVWRLMPRVSQLPVNPFGNDYRAESTYLEVRHVGYRPEFVPLSGTEDRRFEVRLSPVLNKRIAVLEFPALDSTHQVPEFSQVIATAVVSAIERVPELATYGYLIEPGQEQEGEGDYFLGRPSIQIGNEVLRLHDVQAVQEQLESVDTRMVSGEGRFLQRKTFDIQFVVHGTYRLFNEAVPAAT